MGFRLKKVETFHLKTSDEARALALKLTGYGGTESEREDKAKRKGNIKAAILGNEMLPFRWATGLVLTSGLERRVNGQHGSEVFLELTPEEWAVVVFPVFVTWEHYECDDIGDLPTLFEQFDPAWSSRNSEDIIGAHMGIHSTLPNAVSRYIAMKATSGMAWYREKVEGATRSPNLKFTMIHENALVHEFMIWCGSFLQKKKTEEMHPQAVIAAMYHTVKGGEEEPRQFWKRVASGKAPLDADTVEYKLAEFLEMAKDENCDWPNSVKRHFQNNKKRPSELDIFATCIRAFTAFSKGMKTGDIFTPAKGRNAVQVVADLGVQRKAA